MQYTVKIGDKETNVRMKPDTIIDSYLELTVEEYSGGHHNFDGIKGAVINKAVEKLWGKQASWFGDCERLDCGQVVGGGGWTLTQKVWIEII